MQNFNLMMTPHHFHLNTFRQFSERWSKFNTFSIILIIHILIFSLLIKQSQYVISALNQHATPVKIFNLSLSKLLEKVDQKNISTTTPNDASSRKIENSTGHQNLKSAPIKANIITNSSPPTILEKPAQIVPVEFDPKPLASLTTNNNAAEGEPNSKNDQAAISDSNEESGKELRLEGHNDNVIEILRLGSSKGSYSIPNLSDQNERLTFGVEVGDFPDIETAIINHIISYIRSAYSKDISWNSKVKARMVKLSMRPKDHAALEKFLRIEIFGKNREKDYSHWDKSKF